MKQILIIDDDSNILGLLRLHLNSIGYVAQTASSSELALELLKKEEFDLVITDLKMSGMNGLELCERITGNCPGLPVLIMTAFATLDVAVEAIRMGAYDFVVKPINFDALTEIVTKAITSSVARKKIRRIESATKPSSSESGSEIIGESRPMVEIRELISKIADIDTSVLFSGESGTGKALVSEVLHRQSKRSALPYVVVNCATISEESFEQTLFGRQDMTRTGKKVDQPGLIAMAQDGTLFFDEIGHLPISLQPKLLRLFEERLYRPLGSSEEALCQARFVFATNGDLNAAIREGKFREDLLFRINVMHVKIPPLRERGNDSLILADRFLRYFAERMKKEVRGMSDPVVEKLAHYEWLGNVRELRNTIERAVAVARYDQLVVEDLPEDIQRFKVIEIFKDQDKEELIPVDKVEQRHILGVLKELNGNKAMAAKVLGLDRKTLYRKLERYGYSG